MKRKATSSKPKVARKKKRMVKTKKRRVKRSSAKVTSRKTNVKKGERPVAVGTTRNAPKRRAFVLLQNGSGR